MTLPPQKFRCQSCCNWFTDIKEWSLGGIQWHNVYTKFEKTSSLKIYSMNSLPLFPSGMENWVKMPFEIHFNINRQITILQHKAIMNYWTLLLGSEWEGAEAVERQQPRLNLNFTQQNSTCRKVNWVTISPIKTVPLGGWHSHYRTRLRTERSGFKYRKL